MTILPFGEFLPDLSPLTPGAITARNVIPAPDGYSPMPQPVVLPPNAWQTDAMALQDFVLPDGATQTLAFNPSSIARLAGVNWITVGSGYAARTWRTARWGDAIYAVNGFDPIQKATLGGGLAFAPVAGLTNALSAYDIAVVGEFLVLCHVVEDAGNTDFPYRYKWSGLDRPDSWDPSEVTQSDYQDVTDIGPAKRILGGEFGLLLGADGSARMDFIGAPEVWSFRTVDADVGCDWPGSAVKLGGRFIWHSRRGWRGSTGGPSESIGYGKVDDYTVRRVKAGTEDKISVVALPNRNVLVWSYISVDGPGDYPDEYLAYSLDTGRWSNGALSCQCLGEAVNVEPSLDDMDPIVLDAVSYVMDSRGSEPLKFAACLTTDGRLAQLVDGQPCNAVLTTAEAQLVPGMRARMRRMRPLVHSLSGPCQPTAIVYTRETQDASPVPSVIMQPEVTGSFSVNRRGRYHRVEVRLAGPFDRAVGVDVTAFPAGMR